MCIVLGLLLFVALFWTKPKVMDCRGRWSCCGRRAIGLRHSGYNSHIASAKWYNPLPGKKSVEVPPMGFVKRVPISGVPIEVVTQRAIVDVDLLVGRNDRGIVEVESQRALWLNAETLWSTTRRLQFLNYRIQSG